MNIKFLHIVVFLCFLFPAIKSQINCTVPLPPVLTSVSVVPETGIIEFKWLPSESDNIAAYLVYEYFNENNIPRGNIIDTIWNPAATSYSYVNSSYKYNSSSFVVAAYRAPASPGTEGCPSKFSNILNTIFTSADIDTCTKKIIVSWNKYPSSPKRVLGYSVISTVNGSNYTEAGTTDPETVSLTFQDFEINTEYCYFVRANLEDGSSSTSNKICIVTRMQKSPDWINADYATIDENNRITLSFSVDPSSEISQYRIEKMSGSQSDFQVISDISTEENQIKYTDNQSDISKINTYRLSAINNCKIPVTVSNNCSNIVLKVTRRNNDIDLSWNSYREWTGDVSSYQIFVQTGSGFDEEATLMPADTTLTLQYDDLMYQISGSEICFYVRALEKGNPYGVTGESSSPVVCLLPTEIVTVPNVFTPNNDLVNDYFRPYLSFTPKSYHLVISDRNGKVLFESNDYSEVWDGSTVQGTRANGVCLWFLETTTPSGKLISKTGTITIIKRIE